LVRQLLLRRLRGQNGVCNTPTALIPQRNLCWWCCWIDPGACSRASANDPAGYRGQRRRDVPAQGLGDVARRPPALHGRLLRVRRLRVSPAVGSDGRDGARPQVARGVDQRPPPPTASRITPRAITSRAGSRRAPSFALADEIARKVSDFPDPEGVRTWLAQTIARYRRNRSLVRSPTSIARRSIRATTFTGSEAARSAARRAAWRSCACCLARSGGHGLDAIVTVPRRSCSRPTCSIVHRRQRPS